MLYRLLQFPARLAFWFYCRRLRGDRNMFSAKGPLLIACNHPNSFLDAIIISTLFRQPVHSLARGDVFKHKAINKILRALNMMPVYRTTEGVENMSHNYTTFSECIEVFRRGGIVLIFSEGRCVNEWHLRPLMKGTARLALSAWEQNIPLRVLPAGINYQSFRRFGKNVDLNFAADFGREDVDQSGGFGQGLKSFNKKLSDAMQPLVYEIAADDVVTPRKRLGVEIPAWQKIMLLLPAVVGLLLHLPLYFLTKQLARRFGNSNDHYDSIAVSVLFLLYPLYFVLVPLLAFLIIGASWLLWLYAIMPFCGWCYMYIKKQF